ncbi:aspartyl/asparaginyl beta-hydroxylase domain-containing protein [Parvibaculaceae bacterium PLY_AMNH_Bact1]|nr:aspartyl/asparaginyl beta-hydroxylase domain-containing protein [Parvibaculaceae bacterium PLY_AMNH_Bact1]
MISNDPSFELIATGIQVAELGSEIEANNHLWGEQSARVMPGSPHEGSTDIWVRFRDLDQFIDEHGSDMSAFCDEHESVWLAPALQLPAAKRISDLVLKLVGGSSLGGVLLTKLEPGGRVLPHIDSGWHADVHEKYYVAVKVRPGARFCWEDGQIAASDGDVWRFRNDRLHWVENDSDEERIAMIVCVKR